MVSKNQEAIHHFRLRDEQGCGLLEHGGIWLLELSKCVVETVNTEQQRWLKFFIEGSQLNDEQLPAWMHTQEMQQAMSTLRGFSEKERAYHRYQARQNYLREQKSLQSYLEKLQSEAEQTRAGLEQARVGLEQARAAEEQARAAEERERAEKEAALAEITRLKALLPPSGT